jgi:hypothetical protein
MRFVAQPYSIGLYVAGTQNGQAALQLSVSYDKLDGFVKQVRDAAQDLIIGKLGDFLDIQQ